MTKFGEHRRVVTSGKCEVAGAKWSVQNHSLEVVKAPEA